MIYFTSDTHFGHSNVIKYCNRPFEDVDIMDNELIKNWNATVSDEDTVYHLGDFALAKKDRIERVISTLNGYIHFIRGNHDHSSVYNHERFETVDFYREISVPDAEMGLDQKIILCHYPIESWNHRHHGSWHLHGHCHGTLASADHQARLDVGVDVHGYAPISYEKVKEIMTRKVFKPIDHHI